jgi:hypothetical protein
MEYARRAATELTDSRVKKKIISKRIVVILLLLAALSVGGYVSFQDRYPARFRWIPEKEGAGISEVIGGSALVVPFEFLVENGISRVKIEISDDNLKKMGVFLSDTVVIVENGKAYAKAYFTLEKDAPPRRYTLEIIARDAATEKVIGKGSIPFAVYPYFYNTLKCSC